MPSRERNMGRSTRRREVSRVRIGSGGKPIKTGGPATTAAREVPEQRQARERSTREMRATSRRPRQRSSFVDFMNLLNRLTAPRPVLHYRKNQILFTQGDRADSVFYIQTGEVKLSVISPRGKAAIIAILRSGDFVGEGCLAGQPLRMATASTLSETVAVKVEKALMASLLLKDAGFSELFVSYLLSRTIRIEEDLVDHLFNSSEKRLARILLLLAGFGKKRGAEPVIPRVRQETLAEMIGTTRARVSGFMNKFRRLGLIEYNGGLRVHDSLMNVIVHD